jgi:folate-dependent phosphoribosylglycinamide formyltransferase PurN
LVFSCQLSGLVAVQLMTEGNIVHYVAADGDTGPIARKVWRGAKHGLD